MHEWPLRRPLSGAHGLILNHATCLPGRVEAVGNDCQVARARPWKGSGSRRVRRYSIPLCLERFPTTIRGSLQPVISLRAWSARIDLVTSDDWIVVMTKVGIAQLKAHLSRYVRGIRRGETVVVLDRNQPVARIVPFQNQETILPVRGPLQPLRGFVLPPRLRPSVDSLPALLEERRDRR